MRDDLLRVHLGTPVAIDRVQITRIELAPGAPAGLHRHPFPVIGCVLGGAIRLQIEGRPEQILRTGEAFHEPAGTQIPHFDNASEIEPGLVSGLLPARAGRGAVDRDARPERPGWTVETDR